MDIILMINIHKIEDASLKQETKLYIHKTNVMFENSNIKQTTFIQRWTYTK